jgi:predicted TIM-barrel fold metal-dependent hydrolase
VEITPRKGVLSGAIDADVHPNLRHGIQDLAPYLDEAWARRLGLDRRTGWGGSIPGMQVDLPVSHYTNIGGSMRLDAIPPEGGPPGSDPGFVVEDLLDRFQYGAAILTSGTGLSISGYSDAGVGAAVATAQNRWLEKEWLEFDDRFKGSIIVGPRDPASAVEEIERWAGDPRMVQVYIPNLDGIRLGTRHFWPIFEAAEHFGLPIAVHPGGETAGVNGHMSAVGPPSYYFEYHSSHGQIYQAQLISLVAEGVFERFPKLMAVFIETGYAWLIEVMWRLDQKWHAVKDEVPWLTRLPSEYIREKVRVASQPMYEPSEPRHLEYLLEMIHADELLCFSSDYPHWDTDDPVRATSSIPAKLRRKVMIDTPAALYGLEQA